MSLSVLGCFIAVSAIALLLFVLRSKSIDRAKRELPVRSGSLEKGEVQLETGEPGEVEAARLALLHRSRSSFLARGLNDQHTRQPLTLAAGAILLISGIGGVVYYLAVPADPARSRDMISFPTADGEVFQRLKDYSQSIGNNQALSKATSVELLPDVNSMIEKLAARLETTPQDIDGWRMLGWSYFQTMRFEEAATAFGKALALDPNSADLQRSYEEAKAKASESNNSGAATSSPAGSAIKNSGEPSAQRVAELEAAITGDERDAAIRSMVDGLALRLESAPHDVDGWIRLMRSRIVLHEREMAESAFRKALEVFRDDTAASDRIVVAAIELGLGVE